MRDDMIINTTVKSQGNSWVLPISKKEKELLCIEPGDDLEVRIIVRERKIRPGIGSEEPTESDD